MRSPLLLRALLAAVLLVAASCGSDEQPLSSGEGELADPAEVPDSPPTDDEGWSSAQLGLGSWTGARTSPDGQALVVTFVGGAPYAEDQPCTVGYRAVVTETASTVEVEIQARQPPQPDELFCHAAGSFRHVEAQLAEPLGDRSVVEEHFARTQPVFDGALLAEPTWLPEGWTLMSEGAGFPEPERATSWMRTWGGAPPPPSEDGTCTPSDSPVTLTQGPVDAVELHPTGGQAVSTHDVNGREATLSEGGPSASGAVWLSWVDGPQSFVLMSGPSCSDEGTPSVELLVRVAEGLRVPGD